MRDVRVNNMAGRTGNPVPNQFIIETNEGTYFQSYDTIIAFRPRLMGKVVLDEDHWDFSSTTGKYRNDFLGEGIAETRLKIKQGIYRLDSLN